MLDSFIAFSHRPCDGLTGRILTVQERSTRHMPQAEGLYFMSEDFGWIGSALLGHVGIHTRVSLRRFPAPAIIVLADDCLTVPGYAVYAVISV